MLSHVVFLSVCLRVRLYWLKIGDLVLEEHLLISRRTGVGWLFSAENLQYLRNGAR